MDDNQRHDIIADVLVMEPEEIKHALDMRFLMERFEHGLEKESRSGKSVYTYRAWTRDDNNPSFDVWYEPDGRGWHFNDPAEPDAGDVFDLIGKLLPDECPTFGHRLRYARDALTDLRVSEWEAPEPRPREPFTPDRVRRLEAEVSRDDVLTAVEKMLRTWTKPLLPPGTGPELIDTFRLSYDPAHAEILIPILAYDTREMVGCKRRRIGSGGKISEPGSNLSQHLYGEWRLVDDDTTVLLCEGESDTWAAAIAGYAAVGVLGAGIAPTDENTACLAGREVIICFDGDRTGRAAAGKWARALPNSKIAPIPLGSDIGDLDFETLNYVVEAARPILQAPADILVDGGVFAQALRSGMTKSIASFSLIPLECLGTSGWKATLVPLDIEVTISREDFNSERSLNTWAGRHGVTFYGSGAQAKKLAALMDSLASTCPTVDETDQLGYYKGTFVWGTGYLGRRPVIWLNRSARDDVNLPTPLDQREYDPATALDVLDTLIELHTPEIMHPMMAWAALAPLRPVWPKFPVLGVFGSSESGKTTITEIVLSSLVGTYLNVNLTSTSPFGVSYLFDISSGVPVWFDEYRYGARTDTRFRLEQHIRDAYDGAPSIQGTVTEQGATARYVRTMAPCVLSGEDFLAERSQLDRTILVETERTGQNQDALHVLQKDGGHHLGTLARTWMEWLFSTREPRDLSVGVAPDRKAHNEILLSRGWDLLSEFRIDHGGSKLPQMVLPKEHVKLKRSDSIADALITALETNASSVIWPYEGHYAISPSNLVQWVRSNRYDITLPGGNRAVRSALKEIPGNYEARVENELGSMTRALLIPKETLDNADD